jgi:hypothetical protein
MGSILMPKPKKVDTSAQDALLARQKKDLDAKELQQKNEADALKAAGNKKLQDQRKRRANYGSLLSGGETGVASEKRSTLG